MQDHIATVIENSPITKEVYRLVLQLPHSRINIQAGQFVMLSVGDDVHLLRRPFAICEWEDDTIVICYQLKGNGTKKLATQKAGDRLSILLPLGNGFEILPQQKKVVLVGGGVGIFPLIAVLKQYHSSHEFYSFMGFRNKEVICYENMFTQYSQPFICTDDGSYTYKGNAVEILLNNIEKINPDVILACGPTPMLRALQQSCIKVKTFVSLEERMGCGIGACLVCVCKKEGGNANVRVCKDGPVFNINDIIL